MLVELLEGSYLDWMPRPYLLYPCRLDLELQSPLLVAVLACIMLGCGGQLSAASVVVSFLPKLSQQTKENKTANSPTANVVPFSLFVGEEQGQAQDLLSDTK